MGKETSYWLEEGGTNIFLLVLGKRLDDSVFGLEKEPPRYRIDGKKNKIVLQKEVGQYCFLGQLWKEESWA